MSYTYFSRNGKILPLSAATISLDNTAYAYGFGVYESIRLSKSTLYFSEQHVHRLLHSAQVLGLSHPFTKDFITSSIIELIKRNDVDNCNVKILLIGDSAAEAVSLNILCLNPLFPDRKLYKNGCLTTVYEYEREFPQAKSLNMLPSYLAFREAKAAGAYDALLVSRDGTILEGTRTNFLALQGRHIFSPPEARILPGVTRQAVLEVARNNRFEVVEQEIPLASLGDYDSACITSTSSKIMPVRQAGSHVFGPPSENLRELLQAFDDFLQDYAGIQDKPNRG